MYYYMVIYTDGHALLCTERNIADKTARYSRGHPRSRISSRTKITKQRYHQIKNFTALQWTQYMQGNPLKEPTQGYKDHIARLYAKEYSP